MSINKKKKEEEVDLGSILIIIGRGISRFFHFIGSIFKGLFHFIIIVLLFLKQHRIKIGIAITIGIIFGLFIEFTKSTKYGSDLVLQPNFKSSRQLYNNINYYNDLVKQKDIALLMKTFDISKNEATALRKFEVNPIVNENDIISSYDDLILSVDTTTVKSYSFDTFKRVFTKYDYTEHLVHVEATANNVFSKLDEVIISQITQNKYYNTIRDLNNKYLNRTDSLLKKNLMQVDSLQKVYMQVLLDESKKASAGTNIDLGGEKGNAKELELFETTLKINKKLKEVTDDKAEKYEIINVISNFQPIGYELKGVTKNYAFLMASLAAGIVIIFLLLKQLNSYLNNYKKG